MEIRTLEQANKRLLEKRERQKTDTVSQIESLLFKGDVDKARRLAFKSLLTPQRDEIIRKFKEQVPENGRCRVCDKSIKHEFLATMLKYRIAEKCTGCMEKEEALRQQKEDDHYKEILEIFERQKKDKIATLLTEAGIPPRFIDASLGDYKSEWEPVNYFLTSDVGVGKTHLSVAMMREYVSRLPVGKVHGEYHIITGILPIFINVADLLLAIRSSFDPESTDREVELVDKFTDTPLLILDDLGIEKTTPWALQTLYTIINRRYNDNTKRTIITSNLSLDTISGDMSNRIASRIKGMCRVVKLSGRDRRLDANT